MDDVRKGYVTIDEVAKIQGCSRRTVFRLISSRGIDTVKIPGDRRTHLREADAKALFRPVVGESRRRR
jgi:excisionase family DNA binding protein